jgi:hypothetical protein
MKKSILIITFVTQLITTAFATITPTTKTVSLVSEDEIAFTSFIENSAPMFYQIESDNWKNFQKVVTLYNVSTSNLMKVNETERSSFLISSKALVKELKVMSVTGSEKWISRIESTTAIIKFTWEIQEAPVKVEFEQAPAIIKQPMMMDTNFLGK